MNVIEMEGGIKRFSTSEERSLNSCFSSVSRSALVEKTHHHHAPLTPISFAIKSFFYLFLFRSLSIGYAGGEVLGSVMN